MRLLLKFEATAQIFIVILRLEFFICIFNIDLYFRIFLIRADIISKIFIHLSVLI